MEAPRFNERGLTFKLVGIKDGFKEIKGYGRGWMLH